jgi:signal peptidase II
MSDIAVNAPSTDHPPARAPEPAGPPDNARASSRRYAVFGALAALSLVLDQWTKMLARAELKPAGPFHPKVVIENYFMLRYSENPGVAFGMLQSLSGGRVVLTLLAVAALVMVLAYLRQTDPRATRVHAALGLIGGGAIGNLIDRAMFGRVTDFIVWHVREHEWPDFNIADAALCIGVGLLALDVLRRKPAPPAGTAT